MKTIVLTGGGTAGHVVPNMALIPELSKYFEKICYIGSNGIEKQIVKNQHIPFYEISAVKLIRNFSPKNLLLPFKLIKSIKEAKKVLIEINPDAVFSKGGFVALPVVIAAKKLKIPVISHESDLTFGLANKIILHYADLVCTSFQKTAFNKKKCVFTGSPIRKEITEGKAEIARKICGFKNKKLTLLFFGGSLGAQAINHVVFLSLDKLLKNYNVIHIVGKGNSVEIKKKDYYQMEYTNQIEHFYALSDIIISRAGANSIFELLAIKKPMILIPLPKKQSRGDQIENATYFASKGYSKVIHQENFNTDNLLATLKNFNIVQIKANLNSCLTSNANQKIVGLILKTIKKQF